jgi:cell shape-determining protein MreC
MKELIIILLIIKEVAGVCYILILSTFNFLLAVIGLILETIIRFIAGIFNAFFDFLDLLIDKLFPEE